MLGLIEGQQQKYDMKQRERDKKQQRKWTCNTAVHGPPEQDS